METHQIIPDNLQYPEGTDSFVYCWEDTVNNMFYIGSHRGGFDDGYVCSSKPMMAEYKKRPEDFKRYVLAHGLDYDSIREMEYEILKSFDAASNPQFYNKHNGGSNFRGPKEVSERTRKILSKIHSGSNHFSYGKPRSKEVREKISKKLKGRKDSQETRRRKTKAADKKRKYPFPKLQNVGDEISILFSDRKKVVRAARSYARNHGMKFSTKKVDSNKIKIIRIK